MAASFGPAFIANFSAIIRINSTFVRPERFSSRSTPTSSLTKTRSLVRPANSTPSGQVLRNNRQFVRSLSQANAEFTLKPVNFTLGEIAALTGGELVGDSGQQITGAAS